MKTMRKCNDEIYQLAKEISAHIYLNNIKFKIMIL